MLTVEALQAYGADTADGLRRCMGMEEFYLGLVKTSAGADPVTPIAQAIAAGDLDGAFEAAHALKGVLANLALTPMLTPVTEMTELLRARTQTDYSALLAELQKQYAALCEIIAS